MTTKFKMPPLEERIKNFDKRATELTGPSQILVFKEKHGELYFAIPDLKALYDVANIVLKVRFEQGYFEAPDDLTPIDTTLDEINAIKSATIKERLLDEYNDYQKRLKNHNQEKAEYDRIAKAVKDNDGRIAWSIIRDRNDHEYEEWDTITLADPTRYYEQEIETEESSDAV